jgi:hypothetical protein
LFFLFLFLLFFLSLWLFWLTALLLRDYYLSTPGAHYCEGSPRKKEEHV